MDGLREACDLHVTAVIRAEKLEAMAEGRSTDPLGAIRSSKGARYGRYLAAVLSDSSQAVDHLLDELIDDAVVYLGAGVESGQIRATDQPRRRATLAVIYSIAPFLLHHQMKRLLGVDPTDYQAASDNELMDFSGLVTDVLGRGIFTDEFADELTALTSPDTSPHSSTGPSKDTP